MANPEHLDLLTGDVQTWNAWRSANPDLRPDLERASLIEADLSGANLSHANLFGVLAPQTSLAGADLRQSDIRMANLSGAVLTRSDLYRAALCGSLLEDTDLQFCHCNGADFSGAHLARATLVGSSLWGVDFERADLQQTDFARARMGDCSFADTDLSECTNLEQAILEYACVLDHRTLSRSKTLPVSFLRSCGLSESMLQNLALFLDDPMALASCFVSYSSHDKDFASRLYVDLQNAGVRCWFAPEDLKTGDRLRPTFDRQIELHDRLLLILSAASVASQWVEAEVERALERERVEGRTVLFPVRVDDSVFKADGWAALIRNTRHIGDFTAWPDDDGYQRAFKRLVRDLREA